MNFQRMMSVIKGPHVSEKGTLVAEKNNQVALRVDVTASKNEIKKAVEKIFNVDVKDVSVVRVKGKTKHFAQRKGKRSDYKKAYVRLAEGHDINFATTE